MMTTPDPTEPEKSGREFKNYSWNFFNVFLTARTRPLVTFICLVL
jgi:hypothetical protein